MEKKEFYQQALLMAFNALLSANGNAYETEYLAPHQTTAAMAHDYALALTQKMYIEINKDINNLK